MQWASGGRNNLAFCPQCESLLLSRITLNQRGVLFVVMAVSERFALFSSEISSKHEMWAEFESGWEWFRSSLLTFPRSFECKCRTVIPQVNQMDEQNVRHRHPPVHPHTHTRTHILAWGGWRRPRGSHGSVSLVPPPRKNESFKPFRVWLCHRRDSWPPNSLNLVVCRSWKRVEAEYSHKLPSSSLCYPCYNTDNMANKSWTAQTSLQRASDLPTQHIFLTVNASMHHIYCLTVYGTSLRCSIISSSRESVLPLNELQPGHV